MEGEDRGNSSGLMIVAFLSGALLGAAMAVLLAPQTGRESREQLRKYARRAGEDLGTFADEAAEAWGTAVERGREFLKEKTSLLAEAFEAGREAMRREREKLAGEAESGKREA
jgi:gas vesicle protein